MPVVEFQDISDGEYFRYPVGCDLLVKTDTGDGCNCTYIAFGNMRLQLPAKALVSKVVVEEAR